jgi:CBS domain-containing protein
VRGVTTLRASRGSQTVAEAMLSIPRMHSPGTTVGEVAEFFGDDHVHAALIVSPAGHLEAVVERADIAAYPAPDAPAPDAPAAPFGRLDGRTVGAGADLAEVHRAMIAAGRRRVAVIGADGQLLGLLCLKRSRTGFCSDQDVLSRRRELGRPGLAAG